MKKISSVLLPMCMCATAVVVVPSYGANSARVVAHPMGGYLTVPISTPAPVVEPVVTETRPAVDTSMLDSALVDVRRSCAGISEKMNHLKTMAGINTAVTAIGTATGGVALGTGIAKALTDKSINNIPKNLAAEREKFIADHINVDGTEMKKPQNLAEKIAEIVKTAFDNAGQNYDGVSVSDAMAKKKANSKLLGDIRTGTLAASAATNIAGMAIASTNHVNADLGERISQCIGDVKKLSGAMMQARSDGIGGEKIIAAQKIVSECSAWEYVDLKSIDKRATGAAISSGIGAGAGIAGTITSALVGAPKANITDSKKENNLNLTSNVMAGGATAAGTVATVFNATQINAIKRAVEVADKCEGVL